MFDEWDKVGQRKYKEMWDVTLLAEIKEGVATQE